MGVPTAIRAHSHWTRSAGANRSHLELLVGREIVPAMGVVLASWPFGIAAGPLLQPPLAAAEGWC